MNDRRVARLLLGVVMPALTLAAGVVPLLAWRDRLPDPMATHFTLSGNPNGSMSVSAFLTLITIMVVLAVSCQSIVALRSRSLKAQRASTFAWIGGFLAGLGAASGLLLVFVQLDVSRWQAASFPWWLAIAMVVPALLFGLVSARLAAKLAAHPDRPDLGEVPTLRLGSEERALWTERLRSTGFTWAAGAALVAAAAGVVVTRWWLVVPCAVLGVAFSAFSKIVVSVDCTGLTVAYGSLGWPQTHVATHRIEQAAVIDVHPGDWGGWGYRGSLKLMRRAAVVVRSGPGMRLDLHDGSVFVVTVDNPDDGAALLNAEVRRPESQGC